jgi:hypothetical protein
VTSALKCTRVRGQHNVEALLSGQDNVEALLSGQDNVEALLSPFGE